MLIPGVGCNLICIYTKYFLYGSENEIIHTDESSDHINCYGIIIAIQTYLKQQYNPQLN